MKYRTESLGQKPICGLVAMSLVAGVSLQESIEAYQKACVALGRKPMQGNWKGATYHRIRKYALEKLLNVDIEKTKHSGISLKTFAKYAEPNTMYMVRTTGHVQVYLNGCVVDQGGITPIEEFWGKRKRIKDVYIVKKNV